MKFKNNQTNTIGDDEYCYIDPISARYFLVKITSLAFSLEKYVYFFQALFDFYQF